MQKSKTRLYISKTISSNLIIHIKSKQHHFLKNVLRVKIGDNINLFDNATGEWISKVITVNRNNTVLQVLKNIKKMISLNDVWLLFSPIKQSRMNLSIQKATELGVTKIIPCITEYSNVRKINIKSLFDNAVEAAEQSERLDIPQIEKQVDLKYLLSSWPKDRQILYCNEKENSNKIFLKEIDKLKKYKKWAVLVGPEGGFSPEENELILHNKNVISVSLGARVLRSDTATTVSLFCIQQILS